MTAVVKNQVSEALLGTTEEPQLSQQTREVFYKYAIQDEDSGERYLGRDQFIDAIAPESEDYVSLPNCFENRIHALHSLLT